MMPSGVTAGAELMNQSVLPRFSSLVPETAACLVPEFDGVQVGVFAADVQDVLVDHSRRIEFLPGAQERGALEISPGRHLQQSAAVGGNVGIAVGIHDRRSPTQWLADRHRVPLPATALIDAVQPAVPGMDADQSVVAQHRRARHVADTVVSATAPPGRCSSSRRQSVGAQSTRRIASCRTAPGNIARAQSSRVGRESAWARSIGACQVPSCPAALADRFGGSLRRLRRRLLGRSGTSGGSRSRRGRRGRHARWNGLGSCRRRSSGQRRNNHRRRLFIPSCSSASAAGDSVQPGTASKSTTSSPSSCSSPGGISVHAGTFGTAGTGPADVGPVPGDPPAGEAEVQPLPAPRPAPGACAMGGN